jgi:UMF1 family MFS transporter
MYAGLNEMKSSFSLVKNYPVLFKFFLAFMVYMAGLEVVIKFIGIYSQVELELSASYLQMMFIILQFSAAGGALAFGFLETRIGAKTTVLTTIVWWVIGVMAIFFLDQIAAFAGTERGNVFLVIAMIAGAGIGSIQSSSRAVVGLLSPPGRSAQMFGFWGMFMRLAIILGMTFGPVADALGSRRMALLLVAGFFVVGGLMLLRVPITEAIEANRRLLDGDLKEEAG